jgi:oligoendopeptidase F
MKNTSLPSWDLTDLYPAPDAPALHADLARARADATAFQQTYIGTIAERDGTGLASAIAQYERLSDLLGKLSSYAQLLHASDMTHPDYGRFYQDIHEQITEISSLTLFFTLDLNRLEDAALDAHIKASPALAHYAPWLRDIRLMRPYQLADDLEKLLLEKRVAGQAAWSRLFDETLTRLRFDVEGKILTCEEALHLLSDANSAKRKTAAKAIGETFAKEIHPFVFITNTLAKDKAIEDTWRGFASPMASRNLANQLEDEVADALIASVKANYPKLSHRYYRLKAKWLGQEKLPYWDRNAPLPGKEDTTYSWDQAKNIVLDAYGAFSPRLRALGEQFFTHDWIDAAPTAGKSPGAFAHPTVPSSHPYLLLNFQGRQRDVMTLAHELGHGVHQLLAAKQGALMADTPLTLAETASVFGEQLTFQSMLANEKNPDARRRLLAAKVEDMLNTVVRQVAFCEFERKVHGARAKGELSAEQIGGFWMEVQRESLGDALVFEDEYQHYWAYISHFIHSPFYVYAYAFGDCLVNALYGAYQSGLPDFEAKYFAMLEAGGTLRHSELLKPFGLNAADPAFWQKGLDVIGGMIDGLE